MTIVKPHQGKSTHRVREENVTVCGRIVNGMWALVEADDATCVQCHPGEKYNFCRNGHDRRLFPQMADRRGCSECHRIRNRNYLRKARSYENERIDCQPIPNLRHVRWNLGLTQTELAVFSGCCAATISLVERGSLKASLRMRELIILGVKKAQRENADKLKARERRKLERMAG